MTTKQLNFNTTSSNTIAASDNVGAYLRDAAGLLISSKLIAATQWLQVAAATFDGAGTAITSTTLGGVQALDVNIASPLEVNVELNGVYNAGTNPTPSNTGLVGATRAATPAITGQLNILTSATAASDAVVAANVSALDVNAYNMGYNGTTWDRLKSTSGALNVNLSSSSLSSPILVSDVITTLKASSFTAGVTATQVAASALSNRKRISIQNNGSVAVYVGDSAVTTSTGTKVGPGGNWEEALVAAGSVYLIADAASQACAVLEMA